MRLIKEFLNKTNIVQQVCLLDLPKPAVTAVMMPYNIIESFQCLVRSKSFAQSGVLVYNKVLP